MNKIEYTYDSMVESIDGEWLYYYEIYEKNGEDDERFVDRSIKFYDTMKECNEAAEEHCESLENGEETLSV